MGMIQNAPLHEDDLYYADTPVGYILRLKREEYNQSLSDIEQALHIRAIMLDAIEQGHYDDLPGRTYTIGFIRTYAEYLGLNAERMVKLFKSQASSAPKKRLSKELSPASNDNNVPKLSLVSISILLFIAGLVFMGKSSDSADIQIRDLPASMSMPHDAIFLEKNSLTQNNALNPSAETLYY
ncbi:MAG TPA: hypothetical protein DIU06_03195 [Rhodospirillaceae bacterium]|nr:hypothetical protein [Rhodospirillaceae bacterium]